MGNPLNEAIEVYLTLAKNTVKEFVLADIRAGGNNQAECYRKAQKAVKDYCMRRTWTGRRYSFGPEEELRTRQILSQIDPDLQKYISDRYLQSARREKSAQVSQVSAKGIVESLMKSFGLTYRTVYQKYRVKLIVSLSGGNNACFIMSYKNIIKGDIVEKVPEAVMVLNNMISDFGSNFSVSKRYYF